MITIYQLNLAAKQNIAKKEIKNNNNNNKKKTCFMYTENNKIKRNNLSHN